MSDWPITRESVCCGSKSVIMALAKNERVASGVNARGRSAVGEEE